MGNCIFKQKKNKNQSIVKLTCPYCNLFNTFDIKKYDKHIISCINFKKDFTNENIIFISDCSQKRFSKRRNAMNNITELV